MYANGTTIAQILAAQKAARDAYKRQPKPIEGALYLDGPYYGPDEPCDVQRSLAAKQ